MGNYLIINATFKIADEIEISVKFTNVLHPGKIMYLNACCKNNSGTDSRSMVATFQAGGAGRGYNFLERLICT